jgi:hypothetical protein
VLLIAWLKDMTPPNLRHTILIVPHHGRIQEDDPTILDHKERMERLPPDARKAVMRLTIAAERRSNLVPAIDTLLNLTITHPDDDHLRGP